MTVPIDPVTPTTTSSLVSMYGAIAVSVLSLVIFSVCLGVAFFLKDSNAMTLLIGAAIANSTACVQYWIGSSSGSQKKDETIAKLQS